MEKPAKKRLDLSKIDLKKAGVLAGVGALILLIVVLCQTFDQVTVPGAEVQDTIIPAMRDCYLSGQALNTALKNAFGSRYAVLSEDNIVQLDAAFEAYDAAFRSGKPTDDAQAAMQACIDNVRAILAARYPAGTLKAA